MKSPRIIKKYPNRRLYDTEISRYITLEEVRQLVLDNVDFRVIDKRTHEDITRSILLQVIAEQEQGGDPIFKTELLQHIIRFYGDPLQSSISRYLELSMQLFIEKQQQLRDQVRALVGQAQQPLHALKDLAEQNLPLWRAIRRDFLRNLGKPRRDGVDGTTRQPTADAPRKRRRNSG